MRKRLIKHGIAVIGIAVLAFLAITCVTSTPASTASVPMDTEDTPAIKAFRLGEIAFDLRNIDQAIAEYSEAIRLDPDYAVAYNKRGRAYYYNGKYDLAIADFEAVLRLDSDNQDALSNLTSARQSALNPPVQVATSRPAQTASSSVRAVPVQSASTSAQNNEADFEIKQNAQGTITITGYKGTTKQVVIPATIEGIKVTEIGATAFYAKQLTSVVIPNSVTVIGDSAFSHGLQNINQLTSVIIPDSVITIGQRAFAGNTTWGGALTSVTIPNSVKSIGIDAFAYNQLTSVTIPNSITEIAGSVFAHNKLTRVVIPNNITAIGSNAFANNQLTSIAIPASVKSIGTRAFAYNQLTSVTIGSNNIRGDSSPFYGNSSQVSTITIPANANYADMFPNNFAEFYQSQGKKAGTYTWSGRLWKVE